MRDAYHDELDAISASLVDMTNLVGSAMSRATTALLDADLQMAESVIAADLAVDDLYHSVEERAFDLMARQQPVASDLRTLVTSLRMVADLERMGDLSVHVAKVARLRAPEAAVPAEMVPTMTRMAEVAVDMVGAAARVIADRDVDAARELEREDEEMDELRRRSFRLMLGDNWAHGVEPAIDLALLGRYYERIADHAVSLARRVVYLVTGETVSSLSS
jgi:phosphate transport system protein